MKARAWPAMVTVTVTAFLLAALSAAGEGVGDAGGSPSRAPLRELGVLAPVEAEVHVVVPRDGLWRAPQSSFVCADSVSVHPESGPPLVRRDVGPRQGQFSYRSDGVVIFSAADVGRQVVVRYQFRPRRVALLEVTTPTDYADAQSLLAQALAEELSKRGSVVVSAQEVKDAAEALAPGAISPHALPPPEKLAALAQRVDAAYLLVPGIAVRQHSRPGEFDTGIPIPQEKGDGRPEPFFDIPGEKVERSIGSSLDEEPTFILPVTRYRLYGGARLVVVDGVTGSVVSDERTSDSQRVRWHRFSPARRSLVQSLATQVVAAWREPAR